MISSRRLGIEMLEFIINIAGIGAGLMALVWLGALIYTGWLVVKQILSHRK